MEPTIAEATPTSVYLYYDHYDFLIYVGVTSRGITRNREHNTTKEWWSFVARQEVEHFASRPEALKRERGLIRGHLPPFNTQHNSDHMNARIAYLHFRQARTLEPTSVTEWLKSQGKTLSLDLHATDHLAFQTRLEAASVAPLLTIKQGPDAPPVHGVRGKSGCTRLSRVQHSGAVAVLHTSKQHVHPFTRAEAHVKYDTKTKSVLITGLQVVLDHSEGRLCDRRCPSHLVGKVPA